MEKKIEIGLMLDFYGQLLTKRQEEIMQLYYNHDLSLGEIAQNLDISRQGVFDNIKRSEKALYTFETKLGMVEKFLKQKNKLNNVLDLVNEIETEIKRNNVKNIFDKINVVKENLSEFIKD